MKIPNKRKLQQIASDHLSDIDSKYSMKVSEDYTKEPCSFLVYGAAQSSDNSLQFKKDLLTKSSKTKLNIIQTEKLKISALSSGNVSKYEFLTGIYVLPQKDLLEKATTMKRLEYFPLDKELKAQTDKH